MISRRKVLKILSTLPLGLSALMSGELVNKSGKIKASPIDTISNSELPQKQQDDKSIYARLGVRPLINARGTVTIVGATRMPAEVKQAMDAATRDFVQLDELMEGIGRRLSELTGAEWGCVTSGASAAITAAITGCVTGGNPDKLWQLPDLTEMKNEVIIPSHSRTVYDVATKAIGTKRIEVSTPEELEAALGPQTAMIYLLARAEAIEDGPLSLSEIASIAQKNGAPILVDAAGRHLLVPNPYIRQGADLVAYSGGKDLRGPQCSGLLIGRKDLVQASWITTAPHHGPNRGYKVGREEMIGALTAVERWVKQDHSEERQKWASWVKHIAQRLKPISGVSLEYDSTGATSFLHVEWDMNQVPLNGLDVERLLWDGNPRIAVSGAGSFLPYPPNMEPNISINTSRLKSGEEQIVANRVFSVLSDPPPVSELVKNSINTSSGKGDGMAFAFWPPYKINQEGEAAFDISGEWNLQMKFAASTANQKFIFKQEGTDLSGTHEGDFASRNLAGTLHGQDILVRSSYTDQGVRLNFTFTGTVSKNTMKGKVSLGEYGTVEWKAHRRDYPPLEN